jgi:NAD(P)-dependent dehydrogenase (short-subunit alcohol dehydrogenase family)
MKKLYNKVAVVTGANSGIGFAIAKLYAQQGAKVVLAARREDKLKEAQKSIVGETAICACDVANLAAIENLMKFTKNQYGNVDILVACAGVTDFTHIKDVTEELFDNVVNINYKGVFFTVQRSLPILNKGASIILISSIAARMGFYAHSVYASTKAAVVQLAHSFAADLVADDIRVNAILPGPIDTPIFDEEHCGSASLKEKVRAMIPQKRFGTSDEVAELALYLATKESRFMTGQDIVIDGGVTTLRGVV